MQVQVVPTKIYEGQKPGTSGLRKKVKVFQQDHYLENFVQSIFTSLTLDKVKGSTLLVSGDGRFYNRKAIQVILEIAAANGISCVWVGRGGLVSTPAASAIIRERNSGVCKGGILLTASHNPGGPENDFGIKYNTENGGPAPEKLTDLIYEHTLKIKEYSTIKLPEIDIDTLGVQDVIPGKFKVEIIDPVEDWIALMKTVFDFNIISQFLQNSPIKIVYDGMHGVAGAYAAPLFKDALGAKENCTLLNCIPSENFGEGHPDPNLTYAKELVSMMKINNPKEASSSTPDFGAAGDGDCDRNMILGKGFFVTPSDSVAVIAHYAKETIPFFKNGLKGVSRSMPTSGALDNVAKKLGIPLYEVPTGWKYFGHLMDADMLSICGEESFGTGSCHIREKDGLWAVLAWLSILAFRNKDCEQGLEIVSIETIVTDFWKSYGRNYYCRYDYEEVNSENAASLMDRLTELEKDIHQIKNKCPSIAHHLESSYQISTIDNFEYTDPVDGSNTKNQGVRCLFKDGSRIVWRLSGTGSVGATVRIYIEKYSSNEISHTGKEALKDLSEIALTLCDIANICGRASPTVIT